MTEWLEEFTVATGWRIDRSQALLRGVKVLGIQSRNGRRYRAEALAAALPLYEGCRVNVNHPKGHPLAPRDYQDRIGWLRGVEFRADEGLFADLQINPRHALAEQLLWDAEHAPENVGLSHNVEARTSRQEQGLVVEAILQVRSVDLVADPATTRGLFEQVTGVEASCPAGASWWQGVTLAEMRVLRPDLIEQVVTEGVVELQTLRAAVMRLEAEQLQERRSGRIRQLLREHGLPEPSSSPSAQELIGGSFWEQLLRAPDDAALTRLITERARLLSAAQAVRRDTNATRPLAVEQLRAVGPRDQSLDAAAFARALR